MLSRKKKLYFNTASSLLSEIITFASGFIIPKLIITYYGSVANGLVSSITQFLAFFAMTEMGVGAVVKSSLYKPLAKNDSDSISQILVSSKKFFSKISFLLSVYTAVLMVVFPLCIDRSHGIIYTALLVLAIAFSSLSQYMFGIIYAQLLNADQKAYVTHISTAITTLLNICFSVLLIRCGASLPAVKIMAAIVILIKPIFLRLYVNKHYDIDLSVQIEGEPIKQKWNGLAQHVATYVLKHTDTIVLTIFSTLENVSIYYVYHLVTNGLLSIIETLTSGFTSLFGDMLARNENEKLNRLFDAYELFNHSIVVFLFSCAYVLIIPFVKIYTNGVTDAEYIQPMFSGIIILANAVFCLRMPYRQLIFAAGQFKETQFSSIMEAVINVVVSIALVFKLGLVGVAIGTLAAMTFQTIYLVCYLRKRIVHRKIVYFVKHIFVDVLSVITISVICSYIQITAMTYYEWVIQALMVSVISIVVVAIFAWIFFKSDVVKLWHYASRRGRKND